MRTPIAMALLTLLPLTATAEEVKGTITKIAGFDKPA